MDDYQRQVDKLANSGISDISFEDDVISFSSSRENAAIACIAVPYQEGWTAFVNGEKKETVCVQEGLLGVYLENGEQDVVLEYNNPLTAPAWGFFALGVSITVVLSTLYEKKRVIART